MPARTGAGGQDHRDTAGDLVNVPYVDPGQLRRREPQPLQMGQIAVGLAEPEQPGIGDDLDDGPQCERLMDANGVEQWRIAEGDGRDTHVLDPVRLVDQWVAHPGTSGGYDGGYGGSLAPFVHMCRQLPQMKTRGPGVG